MPPFRLHFSSPPETTAAPSTTAAPTAPDRTAVETAWRSLSIDEAIYACYDGMTVTGLPTAGHAM